jgi:hypothetical protein
VRRWAGLAHTADQSEDQKRQLLDAERALISAKQKLLAWRANERLFPMLVQCHHLLICTTYWVASEMGQDQRAGLKRAWVVVLDLVQLVSDRETQAFQDAQRARNGWAPAGLLEKRAQAALAPVQTLCECAIQERWPPPPPPPLL